MKRISHSKTKFFYIAREINIKKIIFSFLITFTIFASHFITINPFTKKIIKSQLTPKKKGYKDNKLFNFPASSHCFAFCVITKCVFFSTLAKRNPKQIFRGNCRRFFLLSLFLSHALQQQIQRDAKELKQQ
jgi:hypothetical protein